MGRIQSSIGLITGVPIADTVDQLIALSARPRDLLVNRTAQISQEQVAITELTALLIGVQFQANKLGETSLFEQRAASSSDSSVLSVSVTGQPIVGNYQYTPARLAQSHQLLSTGFVASDQAIGAGTLDFRFGGFVDTTRDLNEFNAGQGVQRWKIRITDRSGTSATVDLRSTRTVDDVLDAINNQADLNVTAVADGDAIKLVDNTGQTVSNLKVQEVGSGTTAADLGIGGIDVAVNSATGSDVLTLFDDLDLDRLNDGNGVDFGPTIDLQITLRDGTSLAIDLTASDTPQTLGDVLQRINAADPAKLSAKISGSGDAIELEDETGGAGTFQVASGTGSTVAEDLGIATSVTANTITSRRLLSGLKTSLLASLGGGSGLGDLGQLSITDRAGNTDSVDLSAAQTLDDVIRLINAAPTANVLASVNDSRNGIAITDTSGGSSSLIVANGTLSTADKLQIAVNDTVESIDSGSLDRQVISENTLLQSLNNGSGVQEGSFLITDTSGAVGAVNLAVSNPQSIGDVIDTINSLTIGVVAEINNTGDGIRLRDTAAGSGELTVADSGSGTAAADLNIAGTSTTVSISGTLTEVIDGATTLSVEISATDTLTNLVDNINALNAGVTASIVNDGSSSAPFRLNLASQITGGAGELLIDTTQAGFSFQELTKAQDALLVVGAADVPGAGFLVSSTTNSFDNVLSGTTLTVHAPSEQAVTVNIQETNNQLVSDIELFAEQYNRLRDKLDELTFFNADNNSTGTLFGSSEVLRIENGLGRILTDRFFGVGSIQSLQEIGLGLTDQGQLQVDSQRLQNKLASNPEDVKQLFTDTDRGFNRKIDDLIERLAGEDNSLLVTRAATLQRAIDENNQRVEDLNQRLDRERTRLLNQFFQMEQVIANLQTNLSAIASIQSLPPLVSSS